MILSFHPIITGEVNINCAGRPPGLTEMDAIARADAVFVPQGVREDLYRLCRTFCPLVWPNYDLRFSHPGKVGQSILFARYGLAHPRTIVFPSLHDFKSVEARFDFPYILKANRGGQGRSVWPIRGRRDLERAVKELSASENMGDFGFIRQELLNHGGRDLRVVVIGDDIIAYWRLASSPDEILTNVSAGGTVDYRSDPDLINIGIEAVREAVFRTGINLAGFDLLFDCQKKDFKPIFIEINYFFGRSIFNGPDDYYRAIGNAARVWLESHGLTTGPVVSAAEYTERD